MKLDVFSASAGTGKTYNICEELAARIKTGLDPRRVLACTYTEMAAAELKRRVQKKLIESGMGKEAEALESALLGTLHSVGLRLLTRFAVQTGLSPDLRVMVEGGEERVLKALIGTGQEKAWNDYSLYAARLGQPNNLPLELIQQKRRNAISDKDFADQLRASAREMLTIFNQPLKPSGDINECYAEVRAVAQKVLKTLDAIPPAREEECYSKVRNFTRFPARTWNDIASLGTLKGNKKPGTKDALEPLREMAQNVRHHPALAADVFGFTETLIAVCLALQERYRHYKEERGLVDFTDLEEKFLRLVQNSALAKDLGQEIHLVIVDEFQDTNPVQLAVFQQLSHLTDSSLWVGDPKQAIFGFNGADSELMNAVMAKTKGLKKKTLSENNRSNAALVDLFNQLFVPLFGEEARVTAKRPASARSVECWQLATTNVGGEYSALAAGIAELIQSGTRAGDIAVLARRNNYAAGVAAEIRKLGIPVQVEMPGLLSTRECALAVAALRVVRDRNDAAAAAQVLYLLGRTDWLEKRMGETRGKAPFEDEPVFAALGHIDAKGLSPSLAVAAIFDALELPTLVASWSEAGTRSTHLDSLLALADDFEDQMSNDNRAVTLGGFLNWLETIEGDEEDARRPQAGLNAVNLVTYHSAKGLQWPVVILADLNKVFSPRYWEASVTGGDPENNLPLKGRHLRFWPWPFGRNEQFGNKINDPLKIEDEINLSSVGAPIKAAEEAESLRLLYVGFTRASDRLILASRFNPKKNEYEHKWLESLKSFDTVFGNADTPKKYQLPGQAGSVTVRRYEPPETTESAITRDAEKWLPTPTGVAISAPPRHLSPSDAPPVDMKFRVEPLPGTSPFTAVPKNTDAAALGDACHAYFASLPSTRGLSAAIQERVAGRLLDGFGVTSSMTPKQLVAAGERLQTWADDRYPGAVWHTELPMQAPEGFSLLAGTADLVLETRDCLVIIDHKAIGTDAESAAKTYSGQLNTYGRIAKSNDLWIHLPFAGEIVQLQPERSLT